MTKMNLPTIKDGELKVEKITADSGIVQGNLEVRGQTALCQGGFMSSGGHSSTAGQWYRVGTIYNTVHGFATLITINSTYSYTNNSSITLLINCAYNSAHITLLSKCENIELITGVRVVKDGTDKMHVQIQYGSSKQNNVYVSYVVLGRASSARLEAGMFVADSSTYSGVATTINP